MWSSWAPACLCLGILLQVTPRFCVAEDVAASTEPLTVILDPVSVHGKKAGPALWKVSNQDHVLLILGTVEPTPKHLDWDTQNVESDIARSQEVLAQTHISTGIGFFHRMSLLPSLIGAREIPAGKTLVDVLPPELYRKWLARKQKYIGDDSGVESWRPIFAAEKLYSSAIKQAGFDRADQVWARVEKIAGNDRVKVEIPELPIDFADPRHAIAEFKQSKLDDVQCLDQTMDQLESDLDEMRSLAAAWTAGDVATLGKLSIAGSGQDACIAAIVDAPIIQERGFQNIPARMQAIWIKSAEAAIAVNQQTFAVLPVSELLKPDGYLSMLRAKGYVVVDPR